MSQLRIELQRQGHPPVTRPVSCHDTARLIGSQFLRKDKGDIARVYDDTGEPLYDIKPTEDGKFYMIERYGIASSDVEIPSECVECGHTNHLPSACPATDCCCGAPMEEEYVN
jgi:hypothetical protein